jgi:hypothetical protein
MRLSDAGLRQRQTKALDPNHRLPPWLTQAAPRDRSNRLLDACGDGDRSASVVVPQLARSRTRIKLSDHCTRVRPAAPEIDQPADKCNNEHRD